MNLKLTSANENVALEVYSIAFRKLEHGEELGLGHAATLVVHERGDDVLLRTSENVKNQMFGNPSRYEGFLQLALVL